MFAASRINGIIQGLYLVNMEEQKRFGGKHMNEKSSLKNLITYASQIGLLSPNVFKCRGRARD